MALTKDFHDLVRARAMREPAFRRGLLREAMTCFLAGEFGTAKIILRDYVNATIGFEPLAARTGTPSKSLMRMLGPGGNPHAHTLGDLLAHLQDAEGVHIEVTVRRGRRAPASPRQRAVPAGRRRHTPAVRAKGAA